MNTKGLQFLHGLISLLNYLRMCSIYFSRVLMFTNLLEDYIRRYNSFDFFFICCFRSQAFPVWKMQRCEGPFRVSTESWEHEVRNTPSKCWGPGCCCRFPVRTAADGCPAPFALFFLLCFLYFYKLTMPFLTSSLGLATLSLEYFLHQPQSLFEVCIAGIFPYFQNFGIQTWRAKAFLWAY